MAKTLKLAIVSVALLFSIAFKETEAAGFSVDLIHRDSLQSPSLSSTSERVANALFRSFNRGSALLQNFNSDSKPSSSEIIADNGEYLLNISIGTPPVETLAIADTGSDLTWIQCKPCIQCFPQKAPIFEPRNSSTFKKIRCNTTKCASVGIEKTSCDHSHNCGYMMSYGDRSISKGDVAQDTVTLGGNVIPNVTIGCGHLDNGTFGDGTSGIIGLGGGNVSLIRQLGQLIQGKFSYCLMPYTEDAKPSKMNFGDNGVVSGHGVVTTPIAVAQPATFYYLTLQGVTIGKKRMELFDHSLVTSGKPLFGPQAGQEGNIIIDSGTTLTFLPNDLYNQVLTEMKNQINLKQVKDPLGILRLCYAPTELKVVPALTVHFKGADVKLGSVNTFVQTSEESTCLAFAPAFSVPIYGNLAQMNFLVGYDLQKKTVSFKPTDCNKE